MNTYSTDITMNEHTFVHEILLQTQKLNIMKLKITNLFVTLLMSYGVSFAQDNLIQGGDFEDPSIQTFSYENHTCPTYVPGWDFAPGKNIDNLDPTTLNNANVNQWNVRLEMLYEEAPEDNNYQHIRVQRYEWNGWWDNEGLTQTVKIEPQQTYTLSFDCRINPGATTDAGFTEADGFATEETPTFLIYRIKDIPDSIVTLKAMDITQWDKANINNNWERKVFTYQTPNNVDSLTILLAIRGGKVFSWGGNINMWMDIDNVSFVKGAPNALKNTESSDIKVAVNKNLISLRDLTGQNNISIFTVSGQLIKSIQTTSETVNIPVLSKGVYIVHVGTKSIKVIV